ncbi:hypothetical protein ACFL7M_00005 [Thermodesulfobacteriota bacterium]
MDNLKEFIKKIQSDERFKDFDEAAIKQAIVLKILSLLEWDPFNLDEIQPEYRLKDDKVDFALKYKESPKVFICVRKDSNNFKERIETLIGWSTQCNVKIAVYTNGLSWWFFLPFLEGSIDDKRFYTIDTGVEKIEAIAQGFSDFLLKENIISDSSVKLAEDMCNKRKEVMLIKEHLPKAWEKIMIEPDKWLVDVVSEVTEDLCGYKPDREKVKEFIKAEEKIRAERSVIVESSDPKRNNKGMSVKSFNLEDKEYNVKSWQEIPWKICSILLEKHKDSFENVLYITLKGQEYFTKNKFLFLMSKEIPNTGIFINTDLSDMVALSLTKEILSHFGHKESDLVINTK